MLPPNGILAAIMMTLPITGDAPSAEPKNNQWHIYSESSNTVIVFVHGYFSSSSTCWRGPNGPFWPDLIPTDARIPESSIFLGGFTTNFYSTNYSVGDCAAELMAALKRKDTLGRRRPLDSNNLIFVCHSLGGIVVREILSTYSRDFEEKNIGLVLLASPSLGSDYATNLSGLISFYRNRIGKQLSFANGYLEELDRRFLLFLSQRREGFFLGGEAIELYAPFALKYLPGFKPIVSSASAGRYFAQRRKIPADHSGISKPDSVNHPSHNFLVDFINEFLPEAPHQSQTPSVILDRSQVLFDTYSLSVEEYYVHREIDEVLLRAASVQSVWISGPSGVGKTCAAKRALNNPSKTVDICLSQLPPTATRSMIADEILVTLHQRGLCPLPRQEDQFQQLSSALASAFDQGFAISIDEVPSGGDTYVADKVLCLLIDLIIALKQSTTLHAVKFVVCSLHHPDLTNLQNTGKTHEYFCFLKASHWLTSDLQRLCHLIRTTLPELPTSDKQEAEIVLGAGGLPRLVKLYFKTIWSRPDLAANHSEVLASCQTQVGLSLIP